jgi:abortive infection bacteriophage resistance protein
VKAEIGGYFFGMHYTKPALTYEEQLALLMARGLTIPDRGRALHWLKRKGYFRLSAYFLPFKVPGTNTYVPGSSFTDIVKLYKFDAHLRLLMIKAIDRVEVALRASITYHFAHVLGPFGHTQAANFTPFVPSTGPGIAATGFDHPLLMRRIETEITQSKEDFVRHYLATYTSEKHLPIWMLTELMPFGTLSKMTEGVKKGLRKQIAKDFRIAQSQLTSWMETLTYIRNICAHHSRLWNREVSLKPELLKEWKADGVSNSRIYCVFLMLAHLLCDASPRSRWKDMLMISILDNPHINLAAMGFPPNWKECSPWSISLIH